MKNNLTFQKIMARGRTIQGFIHFLSAKPERMHQNKVVRCHLFLQDRCLQRGKPGVHPELKCITVHYRGVCSVAQVCPPAHSLARRPRRPRSPTATCADSAVGSPARCCRTAVTPGWLSPAGQPCGHEKLHLGC